MLVAVQLQLGKGSSVTLNRLADTTIPTIQLHGALDLERGRVGGISRNTDEN